MGIHKAEIAHDPERIYLASENDPIATDSFSPLLRFRRMLRSRRLIHPSSDRKGPLMAVLEVFEPSLKGSVDVLDDHCQTVAIAAPGLGSDGVFEFLQALLARPAGASLKVVPKKVKSLSGLRHIHHTGLVRMQGKPSFARSVAAPVPGPLRLLLRLGTG